MSTKRASPPGNVCIQSDMLAGYRELLFAWPTLASALGRPQQLRLVIDANVVIADVRWLAMKRTNPCARTSFEEAVASGTMVAYAPPALRTEVDAHLPRVAREANVPLERLTAAWAAYQKAICFHDPVSTLAPEEEARVRDPKDLPYVYLYAEIGAAAVYTSDADVGAMGAPTVTAEVVVALRDYARAASVDVTIRFGGVVIFAAGAELLRALVALGRALVGGFRRLPPAVQLVLAGIVLAAVLHPRSREWLCDTLRRARAGGLGALRVVASPVVEVAGSAHTARAAAATHWETVDGLLRSTAAAPRRPLPLRVHVLAACVEAARPLTLDALESRVRAQGYVARGIGTRAYLRRVLRGDRRIVELPDGSWVMAAAAFAPPAS